MANDLENTRLNHLPHEPECKHFGDEVPYADPASTHVDFFCDCHRYDKPKILSNGSDIAWPAGWDQEQADAWRRRNGLAYPSVPGAGP